MGDTNKQKEMDISKVLAVLAQPREKPAPLVNVDIEEYEISYINRENQAVKRWIHIFFPKAEGPFPLIYVPHYEMTDDALELREYLKKGWAVASPTKLGPDANGSLTDDDLIFNNAALYKLRRMPKIDRFRVCLVGGSAGGYTALMLTALQLGICGTIANGPITNVYFNSCVYSRETERVNRPALLKILAKQGKETVEETKKDPSAIMKALMSVPLPFHAALSGSFGGVENNFPDPGDTGRWEAFSPTALSEWMCNPVMINHFTSDILVPVDQICKRFTYDKPGSSLPGDFNARMPEDLPGKLNCSFEERISEEKKEVLRIPVDEPEKDSILPFTLEKQFQINIFDEGQIENYGTHRKALNAGRADDIPYLEALFEQTSENNVLTPEKLRELLTRFLGKSVQLPAHTGVDSSIYGSLEVYQKEVCEELADWVRFHGTKALEELFEKICQDVGTDKAVERELRLAMTEIRKVL